jgi:hypothetical protein
LGDVNGYFWQAGSNPRMDLESRHILVISMKWMGFTWDKEKEPENLMELSETEDEGAIGIFSWRHRGLMGMVMV